MANEKKQNILSEKDTKKENLNKVASKEKIEIKKIEETNSSEEISELKKMVGLLMAQNKELKSEFENTKVNMEEMKTGASDGVDFNGFINKFTNLSLDDDKEYTIVCNEICGVSMTSRNGEVIVDIPYKEDFVISKDDLKILFGSIVNKKFFESGIVEFKDMENYKDFKLIKRKDISDEHIIQILEEKNASQIKNELNILTDNKKDTGVYHALYFKIVSFEAENRLSKVSRNVIDLVEQYFEREFKDGIMILSMLGKIK